MRIEVPVPTVPNSWLVEVTLYIPFLGGPRGTSTIFSRLLVLIRNWSIRRTPFQLHPSQSIVHDVQKVGHLPQSNVEITLKSTEVLFPRGKIP